ncbi:hypothetical protein J2T12_001136 [Paenibacillus anaericanus]|nr:hypothetical protein [Paenibacillus anaericanus]
MDHCMKQFIIISKLDREFTYQKRKLNLSNRPLDFKSLGRFILWHIVVILHKVIIIEMGKRVNDPENKNNYLVKINQSLISLALGMISCMLLVISLYFLFTNGKITVVCLILSFLFSLLGVCVGSYSYDDQKGCLQNILAVLAIIISGITLILVSLFLTVRLFLS